MKFRLVESFHWGNSETENNAYLMQYARDNNLISDQPDEGPVYILPNGKFVNLLWFDIDIHGVFFDLFQEENKLTYDDFMGEAEVNLGWIRANSGTAAADGRSYIDVTKRPTAEQYKSIELYFDFLQAIDNGGVMVFCGKQQKTYSFEEYLSEDIVKKIKRYFSSGTLYEGFGDKLNPKYNREFIETEIFRKRWKVLGLTEDDLQKLQNEIQTQPPEADLGYGLFKFRFSPIESNRGQSGSNRVIYLDILTSKKNVLLYIFAKNEQSDLTPEQKKLFKIQAIQLRKEYSK